MVLPYLQRIFDSFPGLLRIYHNDTPCPHLLPKLGRLHCEVWNWSHEMDVAAVRAALGPGVALLGNVAPLDTLARGTADETYAAARACVEKMAGQPGFILSAGGGASPGTPAGNVDALVRAARGR
jgi:uroporphyrinogen decarboxylase